MGEAEGEPKGEELVQRVPDCVARWVAVRLALLLPQRVAEVQAEAVPRKPCAASPPVALMLEVPRPLADTEGVVEADCEPEAKTLAVREAQLLGEALLDTECVAHWVAVKLLAPVLLRVPEGLAVAVPRWPSAAAPPVALGLSVTLPLKNIERVGVMEPEPEDVRLALGE